MRRSTERMSTSSISMNLGRDSSAGGVNWALNQDDNFKALVFDLLYDRKFPNWKSDPGSKVRLSERRGH